MIRAFHLGAQWQAAHELAAKLVQHRQLIYTMTGRVIREQYAGQLLGVAWVIIHPVFLMALYVFVFNVVFRARVGGTVEMPLDYTTYILAGLIPWLGMQQMLIKSTTALSSEATLVKQTVFPVEVIPVTAVLASFLGQIVSVVVLVAYVVMTSGLPFATYLLAPVLFLIQALFSLGLAYGLSVLGAVVRDLKDIVSVFATAGIFFAPIVYLPDWVPAVVRPFLYLNPFSYMVWCYQDAFYFGAIRHPVAWVVFTLMAVFTYAAGYRVFRRMRHYLGNVL